MLTDDRDRLSGSDVVARFPVFFPRDTVELLLNDLFPA
jgi:hypothetical protein